MRLNGYTTQEIESLTALTAAGCSVTLKLLVVKIEAQDESVLNAQDKPELQHYWGNVQWWMPGGYVVYILMTKVPGLSLDLFWDERMFTPQDRHEIRISFRKSYL